jgi:uncharacterized membrane protein YqjE
MSDRPTSDLGRSVQEVTEKAQLLVREEIELAKAEMSAKVNKLIKGAIVGAVAGVFAVVGLLFLLHSAAWAVWKLVDDSDNFYLGYLIVAGALFLLGAIAGLLAARFLKKGSPPTPQMAIEEAQLIKQTVTSSPTPARPARTEVRS